MQLTFAYAVIHQEKILVLNKDSFTCGMGRWKTMVMLAMEELDIDDDKCINLFFQFLIFEFLKIRHEYKILSNQFYSTTLTFFN